MLNGIELADGHRDSAHLQGDPRVAILYNALDRAAAHMDGDAHRAVIVALNKTYHMGCLMFGLSKCTPEELMDLNWSKS